MPDWRTLHANVAAARRQVRNLQIEQLKPGQPPETLELLRGMEQAARAWVKQTRKTLDQEGTQESWRRIWRRSSEH